MTPTASTLPDSTPHLCSTVVFIFPMAWDFFAKYVDEVYAIADQTWADATGKTPGGLTLQQLEEQMQALQGAPAPAIAA